MVEHSVLNGAPSGHDGCLARSIERLLFSATRTSLFRKEETMRNITGTILAVSLLVALAG